jgi:glycosyltransferase involved in cell wall biosynthesis
MKHAKILALGDTPTKFTGFAEVTRNILGRWARAGHEVHLWALNYDGNDYWKYPELRLFPVPKNGQPWYKELGHFLGRLSAGGYTHVWINNDLGALTATDFPKQLRHICATKKVRSMFYFPVDAAVEKEWCEILNLVDEAVTYTEYGVQAVRAAGCRAPLSVVPHGVDTDLFRPLPGRKAVLKELVMKPSRFSERQFASERDILLLNVNKNEWRKDLFRTLEIFAGLRRRELPVKLILRTAPHSNLAGIELEAAGRALGLKLDEEWTHLPALAPETLVQFYNAADLYLTTTLGEGWGLGITEALACGCPVAMPLHTGCGAIAEHNQMQGILPLPPGENVFGPVDARLRVRAHLEKSVDVIQHWALSSGPPLTGRAESPKPVEITRESWLTAQAAAALDWDTIATQMLNRLVL